MQIKMLIINNKSKIIYFFTWIFLTISLVIPSILIASLKNILNVYILVSICLAIFLAMFLPLMRIALPKIIKKNLKEIRIESYYLEYKTDSELNSFKINLIDIEDINFKKGKHLYDLYIKRTDNYRYIINSLSCKNIKKIANKINREIPFKDKVFKERMKDEITNLLFFLKENAFKIVVSLLGIALTIISFVIYYHYNELLAIKIILPIVCSVFAIFKAYNFYFKEKNIFLVAIFYFVYLVLSFSLLSLLFVMEFKEKMNALNFLYYSFFLAPSFDIVIVLGILLLSGM